MAKWKKLVTLNGSYLGQRQVAYSLDGHTCGWAYVFRKGSKWGYVVRRDVGSLGNVITKSYMCSTMGDAKRYAEYYLNYLNDTVN